MEDLSVYFIRHNWSLKNGQDYLDAKEDLFKNKQIGIQFANSGFNEEQYIERSAKTSIRYLKHCSDNEEKMLIVASYIGKDRIYIGTPIKGSKDIKNQGSLEIKYLQLENIKEVTIEKFPLPFLIPPPYATFVNWDKGKLAVNAFYNNQTRIIGKDWIGFLSPWQHEILCEEWLRKNQILRYKLYSTGKSMKDFDIVGLNITGEKIVVAQVKYDCTKTEIETYMNNQDKFEKYFFVSEQRKNDFKNNEYVVSLQTVVQYFKQNDSAYLPTLLFGRIIDSNVD